MIPLPEAFSLLEESCRAFPSESVSIAEALGRFLSQPLRSPMDMPAFPRSAMDGFAVRRADADGELRIVETVAAGEVAAGPLAAGTAVRIMTGAQVPEGCDQVVRVEYSQVTGDRVRFVRGESHTNIIRTAENAARGDVLLSPRRLDVHDIGVAASAGFSRLEVMQRPVLGILSTGNELREPGEELGGGQIYNSNAYQLLAHGTATGFVPRYHGIAADTEDALRQSLEPAFAESDVVALSGGVSMGDFDYVPRVLASFGVQTVFHRVALKPGRPTFFGTRQGGRTGRQYVFGFPGNPVSTFVTFELFAVRLLYRLAGIEQPGPACSVVLGETIEKGDSDRTEVMPMTVRDGRALRVRYGGSSHLSALSTANALFVLPVGTTRIEEGTSIAVRPL